MPRKRKKSSCDRKPQLIFTESPVTNQRNVPSPVCCALHPRTAQTVPVDQLDKSSWVSPQFSSNARSGGRQSRRTLRRRKSPVHHEGHKPKCTCETTGHDQVKGQGDAGSKYKSLEFVGNNRVLTSISVLEEVSIEENVSPNVAKHQRKLRKQSHTTWIDDDCENSPVLKRKVRHKNQRLSTRSVDRPGDLVRGDNSIGPLTTVCSPSPGPGCPIDVCTPTGNKQNETSLQTPVKRLFPGRSEVDGHISGYIQSKSSPIDDFIQSPVCDNVSESDLEDMAPKSRYLLRKYFENTICSTPKDGRAPGSKILVLDTPEAEYGRPARKRQLCLASKETR
ncbi:hypothetical protein KP79_PYT17997 [Mizuhopecten yessoensis]|uniref:Uncharacterized protein n=1 Tax=Mizuhopecten yessoensis TaxID=6573 RepID=A0A210R256_MIZYE|nr:hypothetical protein KP79_PYT17997 [Mizuhopecten yessoensis]